MSLMIIGNQIIDLFHKELWARNPNLAKILTPPNLKNYNPIRSQFSTCHDSWAVVTCANLWPDWIVRIKRQQRKFYYISIMSSQTCSLWNGTHDQSLASPCMSPMITDNQTKEVHTRGLFQYCARCFVVRSHEALRWFTLSYPFEIRQVPQ